ncbi:MAG: hypothetical protein OEO77_04760 [Acidimicrobiia bacterium]|nr:hypothetical protein [Acidimicrobiia bacterium]
MAGGVGEKVLGDVPQPESIGKRPHRRVDVDRDVDSRLQKRSRDAGQFGCDIDDSRGEDQPVRIGLGDGEEIGDHAVHIGSLAQDQSVHLSHERGTM